MIYIGNIEILTAKSAIYLGNVGSIEASHASHETRLKADPFVVHGIVTVETRAFDVKRAIPALDHLKALA